jgi:hypothetical protein
LFIRRVIVDCVCIAAALALAAAIYTLPWFLGREKRSEEKKK